MYIDAVPNRNSPPAVLLREAWREGQKTRKRTVAEELGVAEATENDLYEAMDWLLERQERIAKKLAARHLREGGLVLYDVSSSFYEGRLARSRNLDTTVMGRTVCPSSSTE